MNSYRPTRVLVVTDQSHLSPALLEAVEARAVAGPAQFRLVVLNPARAEVHLLHPERHEKADEAEKVLHEELPALEAAAAGKVIASVSVRHDPMDAIEEVIFNEPVDEVLLDVTTHHYAARLHQDLPHRLERHSVSVSSVGRT